MNVVTKKESYLPAVTGFEPISWKTAAIPTFGRDEDGWEDSEVKSDAGGGGGGAGPLGLEAAFGGAEADTDTAAPVALHTGPKG